MPEPALPLDGPPSPPEHQGSTERPFFHPAPMRTLAPTLLFFALLPFAGAAQAPAPEGDRSEERYEIHLVTMDQGDQVWEMFGHNALVVLDREAGTAVAWNWGVFNFEDVDFIPRFLRGTMLYRLEGMDPEWMIRSYIGDNRSVHTHRLHLSPDEAATLVEHIRVHYLPENRHYVYDYFRDNCSTRIRDALDLAVGGELRAHFEDRSTPRSYRWHSRRLVQRVGWVDQGLSFLLGPRGDLPRTEWEAMFVPMELARLLEDFEREGPGGETRPLLGPRQILFEADRPPTPAAPPPFSAWMPILGFVGGGLLILLGWWAAGAGRAEGPAGGRGRGGVGARAAFGVAAGGWALFSGALGWLLVASWFTDHTFIHWNLNLLYASPLALPLLAPLWSSLVSGRRARGSAGRWATGTALLIAGISVVGALIQATGLVIQGNGEVIALALPINLALAVAVTRIHREALGPAGEPRGRDQSPSPSAARRTSSP